MIGGRARQVAPRSPRNDQELVVGIVLAIAHASPAGSHGQARLAILTPDWPRSFGVRRVPRDQHVAGDGLGVCFGAGSTAVRPRASALRSVPRCNRRSGSSAPVFAPPGLIPELPSSMNAPLHG